MNPIAFLALLLMLASAAAAPVSNAATRIAIHDGRWTVNRRPTNPGSPATEGLLMNVRMVNATFEDRRKPDFDAEANTDRFIARIPDYRAQGVNAFTLCLQGGMPGYEGAVNSAFEPDGGLRPAYLSRVERVIRACDRHGVAVILGLYYQRQSAILRDEAAVRAGVVNTARWVRECGFENVLLEIANEYPHMGFVHALIRDPKGQASLIRLAKETAPGLLVSASGCGDGKVDAEVAGAADFLLPHWNGTPVEQIPARVKELNRFVKPVVCNEDDKTGSTAVAAMRATIANGAGYGLMLNKHNQTFPFHFDGATDDPVFYAELRKLTTVQKIILNPDVLYLKTDSNPVRPTVYVWFPAHFGRWKTDGIEWEHLTHLCFRSVELTADGKIRRPSGNPPKDFVETAHRHGVKVTVLVWASSRTDSDGYLAKFPQEAANNLLAYVKENNLDGVNIDDEQMGATNAVAQASNCELVTRFFQILAKTFKTAKLTYHITFAAPPVIAAKDRFGTSWLDLKRIAEVVDGIIPMGYTQNPPSAGWTTNPEPLRGGGRAAWTTTRDIETMVRDYLDAMGGHKEKLLLGVSLKFGGYEWRCRTDQRLSSTLDKGIWRSLAECEVKAREHGARWDDAQQSPWYCYRDGDAFVQGWFNDARAWKAKLNWVKEQELGGISIWVLDGVNDPPETWQALRQFLGLRQTPNSGSN